MGTIVAWVDELVIPLSSAAHSIFDHVTSYATSVFEGIRVYPEWAADGRPTGRSSIWLLSEHLARLRQSAGTYRMTYPFSDQQLLEAVVDVTARNDGHTYIRPVVFRGDGLGVDPSSVPVRVAIGTVAWGKYVSKHLHHDGASVFVTGMFRPPARFFPVGQAKGAPNYGAWSQLAKLMANAAATSEALLQGEDDGGGHCILDGSGMNLCLVEKRTLVTPEPTKWNILGGLTLRFLLESIERENLASWQYDDIPLDRLLAADEVFLTGTATEVTPVTLIKYHDRAGQMRQQEIGEGCAGPVTKRLAHFLEQVVHGRHFGYRHLLTPVPARP